MKPIELNIIICVRLCHLHKYRFTTYKETQNVKISKHTPISILQILNNIVENILYLVLNYKMITVFWSICIQLFHGLLELKVYPEYLLYYSKFNYVLRI